MAIGHLTVAAVLCAVLLASGCGGRAKVDPEMSRRFERAHELVWKGEVAQARELMKQAAAHDPDNWQTARAIFMFWVANQKPREAIAAGATLLESADSYTVPKPMPPKTTAEIAVALSEQYRAVGDDEMSTDALEIALEYEPRNATASNNIAYDLAENETELDRALSLAKVAVAAEPDNADFVDTLGWILHKQNKHKEAVRHLERSVKLAPRSPELRGHLALARLANKEKSAAYVEARKAITLGLDMSSRRLLYARVIKPLNPRGPL